MPDNLDTANISFTCQFSNKIIAYACSYSEMADYSLTQTFILPIAIKVSKVCFMQLMPTHFPHFVAF